MNDRDRLAADLHAPCEERWAERERQMPGFDQTLHMIDAHHAEADHLIALGWTRRPYISYWSAEGDLRPEMVDVLRDELPKAFDEGKQIVVVDGVTLRFHEIEPSLDEERLARALRGMKPCGDPNCPDRHLGWCDREVAAIAKAYREDTDATD